MPNTVTSVSRRASGRRTLWVSPELDAADRRIADARERVARLSAAVEHDMRQGSPHPAARELLVACQQILREMVVHREAIVAEALKSPRSERARTDRTATPQSGTAR